jgi:hypothetical protein
MQVLLQITPFLLLDIERSFARSYYLRLQGQSVAAIQTFNICTFLPVDMALNQKELNIQQQHC